MPQDVTFTIPFPARYNPHYELAKLANLDWLRTHRMIASQEAVDLYLSWDMADLAARCWPLANPDDLTLTVDLKSFYFLFDDQFDGPQGTDPGHVAAICHELIDIAHQVPGTAPRSPVTASFADLWSRSRDGMSAAWIDRTAGDWERYFASYPYEAVNRRSHVVPAMDDYLETRRGSAATESVTDMVERLNRVEVPMITFHSPQMRLMRQIAADVPFIANDVYSYEKEIARGDVYNLLVVLQATREYTLQEAVSDAVKMVEEKIERYLELRSELPQVCTALALSRAEMDAVMRYAEGLEDWLRGHNDWMTNTIRYTLGGTPEKERPGYAENLLEP